MPGSFKSQGAHDKGVKINKMPGHVVYTMI